MPEMILVFITVVINERVEVINTGQHPDVIF
jgi:hypothetical protein